MKPSQAAARAAALLFALAVWSCDGGKPTQPARPDAGTPSPGRPDAGSTGGTVINAPDNQAQRWVSSDPRYSPTWTFELRQQAAIPVGAREVYVEVRGCRKSYEPPGEIRFRTPESTSSRELSIDKPLCDSPGIPSAQVWLPVAEPPKPGLIQSRQSGIAGGRYAESGRG